MARLSIRVTHERRQSTSIKIHFHHMPITKATQLKILCSEISVLFSNTSLQTTLFWIITCSSVPSSSLPSSLYNPQNFGPSTWLVNLLRVHLALPHTYTTSSMSDATPNGGAATAPNLTPRDLEILVHAFQSSKNGGEFEVSQRVFLQRVSLTSSQGRRREAGTKVGIQVRQLC